MAKWRIEDSAELYNINGWGLHYFSINENGNVQAKARQDCPPVDLKELLDELAFQDISMPVLLRFPDILDNRIEMVRKCFEKAAEEYGFTGQYYSVYPIKVNQTRHVVEEIIRFGKKYNVGLEAGSKPELHAVLAMTNTSDAIIVCNGYKDENFIELALLAQKMGRKIYIVVEKLNELKLIFSTASKLNVRPNIGIRIKLASEGSGKWEDSGGDRSKFGLNASELLEAIALAEEMEMLDCVKLIHFHLGSQITNIRKIKLALREAAQFYVQMYRLGCGIKFVDIGGGLGIDYDGSRSSSSSSVNYYVQEYFNDAVFSFVEAAEKNGLPQPDLITESGRALTSHHSVLIFNVLETTSLPEWNEEDSVSEEDHELVQEMYSIWDTLTMRNLLESWHDAQQIRSEALDLFSLGHLDLETRAMIERLYWSIAREVRQYSLEMRHPPEELRKLPKMMSDKYFCNFSLFQSLPDSWAIDQVFPIIPIHRLNEKPNRSCTIQDITCDSDGRIDQFAGIWDNYYSLPVHQLKNDETYYIGVFLVGAYQEILGDMHNLFGDTNVVHVSVNKDGFEIEQIIDGETVTEVLGYVRYESKKLVRLMETWVSASVKKGSISAGEGKQFLDIYRSGLYGYTYLE